MSLGNEKIEGANSSNSYDVSNEARNFVNPGMQHKYRETVLLYVAKDCNDICDWCFRKRIFEGNSIDNEVVVDPKVAISYLKSHPEVQSVLMTGGDAMKADSNLLLELSSGISEIDTVHNIRFATRALVLNPEKYGPKLPRIENKKTYVVVQIVKPEEITEDLRKITKKFPEYTFLVQTPFMRGINNDPDTLFELWRKCSDFGLIPYYVFQNRPVKGNEKYSLSFEEGHRIFSLAQSRSTGVLKTPRYVMSYATGKWEIVGIDGKDAILRCHQGIDHNMVGSIARQSKENVWWDKRID